MFVRYAEGNVVVCSDLVRVERRKNEDGHV